MLFYFSSFEVCRWLSIFLNIWVSGRKFTRIYISKLMIFINLLFFSNDFLDGSKIRWLELIYWQIFYFRLEYFWKCDVWWEWVFIFWMTRLYLKYIYSMIFFIDNQLTCKCGSIEKNRSFYYVHVICLFEIFFF